MKAKLFVGKLLSIVEKGTISFATGIDEKDKLSEWGRFALVSGKIGAKAVSRGAASYCLRPVENGEEVEKEGCFAVSVSKLKGLLESIPSDAIVNIEFVENKSDDSIGTLLFSAGKSLWKLPCNDPKIISNVKIDDGDLSITIEKDVFLEAISSISFAANQNDANFTKSNICISIKDGCVLFGATDDIRCAVFKVEGIKSSVNKRFLVPSAPLSKILKSFDKGIISVYSGKGFVRFSQEGHSAKVSLPNEADVDSFPAFEDLVSAIYPINTKLMMSKFKTMVVSCNKMNSEECLMKLIGNEVLFFAYDNKDGTSYKSSLTANGDSANLSIGICSMYMVEFLKKVDEEILQLSFPVGNDPSKPQLIMIHDGKSLYYMLTALMDLVHLPPESTVNG